MNKDLRMLKRTYAEHKAELVGKAKGRYVLIKGREIIGIFDTENDATQQGCERFGNGPFLVKQIDVKSTADHYHSPISNLLRV